MKKYYLISSSDNYLWYTEDHHRSPGDRWSTDLSEAHRFLSREEAELEISNDVFGGVVRFFIMELIVKE